MPIKSYHFGVTERHATKFVWALVYVNGVQVSKVELCCFNSDPLTVIRDWLVAEQEGMHNG